jgi:hypothetical protein
MDIVTKEPLELREGDIITRHPERPEQVGRWTVTDQPIRTDQSPDHVWVDFLDEFDRHGVFIVPITARLVLAATAESAVAS